ncbi:MAG: hypothetical protein BGO55_04550 [Sphingobacteriales bacterium 50-39]|nr:RagB/SusD family nutrient uptake outer membrane protein [Sphingobacteriales bacterium]OJW55892.1 MAG: hypothetical protein BGO55_04550 [Sphingobacteriales bacterium 50-39]
MKKFNSYKIYLLLVSCVPGLMMSCQKLKETPESSLTPDAFYSTPAQCEAALTGSMSFLYSTWNGYNATPSWPDGQQDGASLAFTSTSFNVHWQWHYKAIANINPVIKAIKAGKLSSYPADVVNSVEGEARFLRALNYFFLVRLYGRIPFIDENTPDPVTHPLTPASRLGIDTIYDKIEEDLLFASGNMGDYDASTPGKPNKWAAKGMLAKVYLTRATAPLNEKDNYAKARDMAADVIDNGPYDLLTDISQVFKSGNNNNNEVMFAFQSSSDYPSMPGIAWAPDEWGGWGVGPVKVLWAQAYPEQPRKHCYILLDWPKDLTNPTANIVNYASSNLGTPWMGKWNWPNLTVQEELYGYTTMAPPILRFADVLLMYAEAANMANGGPTQKAVDYLNRIITRANTPYGNDVYGNPQQTGTEPLANMNMAMADFDQKVLQERNYELCFEFDRYFDVLRKRILKDVNLPDNANDYDDHDYLFPIPPSDAKYIGQNAGY